MPRVSLYKDKYIESDAVAYLEGKTRRCRLQDKDIAGLIGLSPPAYCQRKKDGKLKLNYMELFKIFEKLKFTDEEIVNFMRGKF